MILYIYGSRLLRSFSCMQSNVVMFVLDRDTGGISDFGQLNCRILMGSVASYVMSNAHVPVTIVKEPGFKA